MIDEIRRGNSQPPAETDRQAGREVRESARRGKSMHNYSFFYFFPSMNDRQRESESSQAEKRRGGGRAARNSEFK